MKRANLTSHTSSQAERGDQTNYADSEPPSTSVPSRRSWRRALITSAVLALGLYAVGAAWSDVGELRARMQHFPWLYLVPIVLLTLVNYGLRLVRWHLYLRLVEAPLSIADTAKVFLIGLPLVATPGKVGELAKSWVVKQLNGAPMSATMPTVLVERLVDGLALLALSGIGLGGLDDARLRSTAFAVLALLLLVVLFVQMRPLALWMLSRMAGLPIVGTFTGSARAFYESSHVLLRPMPFLAAMAVGMISWACEGLAYGIVLIGVGAPATVETLLAAIFIFSLATVVGAVVGTPGGLGGVEGVLLLLSINLIGLDRPAAVAAAILIRVATLWFAVLLGLAAMVRWPDLLMSAGHSPDQRAT